MNVTVGHPGTMRVLPEHFITDRVMVSVEGDEQYSALTLWVKPEVAAQWIEALTPLAAQVKA